MKRYYRLISSRNHLYSSVRQLTSNNPSDVDDRSQIVGGGTQQSVSDPFIDETAVPSFITRVLDFLFVYKTEETKTYKPELPRIVLLIYAVLASALMLISTGLLSTNTLAGLVASPVAIPAITIGFPSEVTVPAYMYAYAVFGTTAYIFANKISSGSETLKPRQAFYRVFAVLPVVAGVYLLWGVLWPDMTASLTQQAGVAFLTGLYVELAIAALAIVANKLVPINSDVGENRRTAPSPTAAEDNNAR